MTQRPPAPALRLLLPADVAEVVRLERELFGPSAWSAAMVREELDGPGRWYVGLDAEGPGAPGPVGARPSPALAAYAGLWFDGEVGQVMTIGVAPAQQGRGLGRLLLDALLDRARELGARAVLLEVRVDNAPAIGLYERAGFRTIGRRRRYYQPEDVDALTMELALQAEPEQPPVPWRGVVEGSSTPGPGE
ncbi:ribosomal protein S18-alanine N-acetyltransferase [Actinotalea sp. BY-33]|uniref:Ribosomal protein S18-alanine N-acetyltransferase n=1 Tax=Actinotalea soli TaxID=2819234 RepID=A0A939RW53_9CELL|nr:ribosomal protein S18-alanine N-acetyltransferase [Actinotalea soli]MBO1752303.1 ribosomal protein S18-alanine N-acetyltransferase [Actinotalea soli]